MTRFVSDYMGSRGLNPDHAYTVELLVEELFTNMLRHGKGGGPDVSVTLGGEREELVVTLRDFEVEPFDPTATPVSTRDPLEGGGLGLRLVHRISDSFRYEYKDRSAIVTVTKRFSR